MFQYNKLSDIQYGRFQILPVDLHVGLFWIAGIPTMMLMFVYKACAWPEHL